MLDVGEFNHSQDEPPLWSFCTQGFFGLVIGIVAIFAHAKKLLCPVRIHAAKASIGAIVFNNQVCLS
jgi:hypothetical protein